MNTLTLTHSETGQSITIPIHEASGTIPASALAALKITSTCPPPCPSSEATSTVSPDSIGQDRVPLRFYDPGLKNTVAFKTKISHIDPVHGRVFYRGYDLEDLVRNNVDFLEVAYLLIYGSLPAGSREHEEWRTCIMTHTYVHAELEGQMTTFRYDAHPMGIMIASIASLSTFHPEANPALSGHEMYMNPKPTSSSGASGEPVHDVDQAKQKATRVVRNRAICRMLGKISTIAANAYRHRLGRKYNHPMPQCTNYAENLLFMMDKLNELEYKPDPRLVSILNQLFVILAEHGANCATVMMRHLTSSGVDPYTALAGAAGALFGERKASAVVKMLKEDIQSVSGISEFLDQVKRKETKGRKHPIRLMGFGSRVYQSPCAVDPRVKMLKSLATQLFDLFGMDHVGEVALALEDAVQADPYFQERQLSSNVDFWTGIVLHTLGLPEDMFPVLMCISRTVGFVAHWVESLDEPEFKIYRPRQIYKGQTHRTYESMECDESKAQPPITSSSPSSQGLPHLETASYIKSDPVAAHRRLTASELFSTAEVNQLISVTQSSLTQLVIDLTRLSVVSGGSSNKAEPFEVKESEVDSTGNPLEFAERLQQIQRNLNIVVNQHQQQQQSSTGTSDVSYAPPTVRSGRSERERAASVNDGATSRPNLISVNKSARVIAVSQVPSSSSAS